MVGDRARTRVIRFLGTSPSSSDIFTVLFNIAGQLADDFDEILEPVGYKTYKQLVMYFPRFLRTISRLTKQHVFIILDSVDQLSPANDAYAMKWLPSVLPSNVHIILSMLPQVHGILDNTRRIVKNPAAFLKLETLPLETGRDIIQGYLSRHQRCLQDPQQQVILSRLEACPTPLFLKLILDQARTWHSYTTPRDDEVASTVRGAIGRLFDKLEVKFGEMLVRHALGYLTVGLNGLTEVELEDALSCDDDVMDEVYRYHNPPVPGIVRVPPLLWTRIRHDIKDYLVERHSQGKTTLYWYHRQFTEAARDRFVSPSSAVKHLHGTLAEIYQAQNGIHRTVELKKRKLTVEKADRQVSVQPLTPANKRKLQALPYHIRQSGNLDLLKESVLFNLPFLLAKLEGCGILALIADCTSVLEPPTEEDPVLLNKEVAVLKLCLDSMRSLVSSPASMVSEFLLRLPVIPDSKEFRHISELVRQCRGHDLGAGTSVMPLYPFLLDRDALVVTVPGFKRILSRSSSGELCLCECRDPKDSGDVTPMSYVLVNSVDGTSKQVTEQATGTSVPPYLSADDLFVYSFTCVASLETPTAPPSEFTLRKFKSQDLTLAAEHHVTIGDMGDVSHSPVSFMISQDGDSLILNLARAKIVVWSLTHFSSSNNTGKTDAIASHDPEGSAVLPKQIFEWQHEGSLLSIVKIQQVVTWNKLLVFLEPAKLGFCVVSVIDLTASGNTTNTARPPPIHSVQVAGPHADKTMRADPSEYVAVSGEVDLSSIHILEKENQVLFLCRDSRAALARMCVITCTEPTALSADDNLDRVPTISPLSVTMESGHGCVCGGIGLVAMATISGIVLWKNKLNEGQQGKEGDHKTNELQYVMIESQGQPGLKCQPHEHVLLLENSVNGPVIRVQQNAKSSLLEGGHPLRLANTQKIYAYMKHQLPQTAESTELMIETSARSHHMSRNQCSVTMAFSHDSGLLWTLETDGQLKAWDVETGILMRKGQCQGDGSWKDDLMIALGGTRLLHHSKTTATLTVYDLEAQSPAQLHHFTQVEAMLLGRDLSTIYLLKVQKQSNIPQYRLLQIDIQSGNVRSETKIQNSSILSGQGIQMSLTDSGQYIVLVITCSNKEREVIHKTEKKNNFRESTGFLKFAAVKIVSGSASVLPCYRILTRIPCVACSYVMGPGDQVILGMNRLILVWDIVSGHCDQKMSTHREKTWKVPQFYRPYWVEGEGAFESVEEVCYGSTTAMHRPPGGEAIAAGSEDGYLLVYGLHSGLSLGGHLTKKANQGGIVSNGYTVAPAI